MLTGQNLNYMSLPLRKCLQEGMSKKKNKKEIKVPNKKVKRKEKKIKLLCMWLAFE